MRTASGASVCTIWTSPLSLPGAITGCRAQTGICCMIRAITPIPLIASTPPIWKARPILTVRASTIWISISATPTSIITALGRSRRKIPACFRRSSMMRTSARRLRRAHRRSRRSTRATRRWRYWTKWRRKWIRPYSGTSCAGTVRSGTIPLTIPSGRISFPIRGQCLHPAPIAMGFTPIMIIWIGRSKRHFGVI